MNLLLYKKTHRSIPQAVAGFTLVEIMVVLGIIALLTGLAISGLQNATKGAKRVAAEAEIQRLASAISSYQLISRQLPSTQQGLQALVSRPTNEPQPRQWEQMLSKVPIDPWGQPYQYAFPSSHGTAFDLWSLGPDGVPSDDDVTHWEL